MYFSSFNIYMIGKPTAIKQPETTNPVPIMREMFLASGQSELRQRLMSGTLGKLG